MDLKKEKKLWKEGFKPAGVDESGRGCLGGPVTAAAVVVKPGFNDLELKEIKDAKKLTPKKRNYFYNLINSSKLEWATSRVSAKVIDRINILEATKLAMKRAVINLERRTKEIDYLLIDGNFEINSKTAQESIIKGDQNVFLIKAASIIAKVSRDRTMKRYHKLYPGYGFNKHKGYPTPFHRRMIKEKGPCEIHRKTFRPVKYIVGQ